MDQANHSFATDGVPADQPRRAPRTHEEPDTMTMTGAREPTLAPPVSGDPPSPRSQGGVNSMKNPSIPHWWRDAVGAATWANTLIVIALWISDGQLQAIGAGWGPGLTSLGRLTGLVSADLLLIQVLLMARIPLAER